ncbi:hypothetical protein HYH03_010214 [Edaphochlamys debaryana]|uniref:SAM-dependent MTase RsmB/NOP-type domain-containing protein n=1 Tax=Edaphochlamys debaryana TaxID=47281 RepID=A0A836BW72_9CHLO|nr:hypothetical protein HYH03_010214 [Edaphochlamys debaryana]|eukprot:KAG2491426.1 hypothetical protein HYH03_010214 [Edaphochlamys debaryana]
MDAAKLSSLRRHLASYLPADLLDRVWEGGFCVQRQPSFRLNTLRLGLGLGPGPGPGLRPEASSGESRRSGQGGGGGQGAGAGQMGGRGAAARSLLGAFASLWGGASAPSVADAARPSGGAEALEAEAREVVRQLLEGFGLDPSTPVEACPYLPAARLLPAACAPHVRVGGPAKDLPPLKAGSAYFMGLSSMLPTLALMAPHPGAGAPGAPAHAPAGGGSSGGSSRGRGMVPRAGAGARGGGREGAPGLRVLDLCAAPGGKTALLADLLGGAAGGSIVAVDASWPRLQRMRYNLERLLPEPGDSAGGSGEPPGPHASVSGWDAPAASHSANRRMWQYGCVTAVHADGTRLEVDPHTGQPLVTGNRQRTAHVRHRVGGFGGGDGGLYGVGALYDRVLVDAPCTGLGRLQLLRPEDTWPDGWDEQAGRRAAIRQRMLLRRAAALVRPGGTIVYSTCTLDPQENEMVVAWLLGEVEGIRLVEPLLPMPMPATGPAPGPGATSTPPSEPGPGADCGPDGQAQPGASLAKPLPFATAPRRIDAARATHPATAAPPNPPSG